MPCNAAHNVLVWIGINIGNLMTDKAVKTLYDRPSDMEPLLPCEGDEESSALALALIRGAERLRSPLHPITRAAVADLVRSMSSYYSNLIEGHRTRPRDIDAALRRDFSTDAGQRSLQLQHLAHMEVQAEMESRLREMPAGNICSAEFLCWLHEEFYRRLPEHFLKLQDESAKAHVLEPGRLRQSEVSVGRHMAPSSKKLEQFLKRFADFYGPLVKTDPGSLIAAAAAHHRLAWIHPFLDGNGRVARLFTHAWFIKAHVDSDGLWTISRGLARRKADYQSALANADERRMNDYDGRGYLSQRYLGEFTCFFLSVAADQVEFMHELLGLDGMLNRISGYGERRESSKELPRGSAAVLRELFLRGEIARGEVARIIGASPRTAQKVIRELLAKHLVASGSPKGPLRLAFPSDAAGHYFPNLYPAGAD
jgi:Fic family protein